LSKRGTYEKQPRDFYPTPQEAVTPLILQFSPGMTFIEPCAGNGALVNHLENIMGWHCEMAFDIEPQDEKVFKFDAMLLEDYLECDMIVTNPPFTWSVLCPMLHHFLTLKTTLLLLPADYMHNKRFSPFMRQCSNIYSIGRVKWIEGSKTTGRENYAWYLFQPYSFGGQDTAFHRREV
jgi:hypothetical protein